VNSWSRREKNSRKGPEWTSKNQRLRKGINLGNSGTPNENGAKECKEFKSRERNGEK